MRRQGTCSSLMRSWSRALSSGPRRPPLLGLMKTTSGHSGGSAASASLALFDSQSWSTTAASASLARIASITATLRYSGIVIFRLSSSLWIRTPEIEQPRIDSIMDDDRAGAEFRLGVPGASIRDSVRLNSGDGDGELTSKHVAFVRGVWGLCDWVWELG